MVLGRMHPARKVTVDVGGAKELEIPQDRPEPLTNMSATVQQVGLAWCDVRHVGCSEGIQGCKAVLKHLQTGCAALCVCHEHWLCIHMLCGRVMSAAVQEVQCCFTTPQVPCVCSTKLSGSKAAPAVTPLWHPVSIDSAIVWIALKLAAGVIGH